MRYQVSSVRHLSFAPCALVATASREAGAANAPCRRWSRRFPPLQIRVFRFLTGKLTRVLDESLNHYTEMQQVKQQVPNMEFGKR